MIHCIVQCTIMILQSIAIHVVTHGACKAPEHVQQHIYHSGHLNVFITGIHLFHYRYQRHSHHLIHLKSLAESESASPVSVARGAAPRGARLNGGSRYLTSMSEHDASQ